MAYQKRETNYVRNKKCLFCKAKVKDIDYKDTASLSRHLNRWNQIESAGRSGNCAKHQRALGTAIKRARFLALLPYTIK